MKKTVLTILILLTLFSPVMGMTMSLVTPESYPLESNKAVTLSITFHNDKAGPVNDLKVGLTVEYPFKTVAGETYERTIGRLGGLDSTTQNFRVLTYDDVPSGNYDLEPYWCTGDCNAQISSNVGIRFEGEQQLQMTSYSFTEPSLTPSQDTNLTINVKNYGSGKANNVILNITNDDDGVTPFIFKDKPNYYFIGDLRAGETASVDFQVRLSNDLEPGVYAIPVQVKSEAGNTSVGDLNFEVVNSGDVRIAVIETDPTTPVKGEDYTLLVTVENVGQGKARSTKATLVGDVFGDTSSYIGVLDKDDSDVALFEVEDGSSKNYSVKVTYEDDLGNHATTTQITVRMKEGVGVNYTPLILLLVITGVAGFLYWWFKKKRKGK